MHIFHCDHCRNLVFFENVQCVRCARPLAFLPDLGVVASLEPDGPDRWRTPIRRARGRSYKLCLNYAAHDVCNWALPAEDPDGYCCGCRLTRTIPNLDKPGHRAAWYRLEVAKRRLVYTLLALGLPVRPKSADEARGLAFEFLADPEAADAPKIMTGHAEGVITIALAEADDAERERRRISLHEPYRTLVGHMRHEVGHYYWDRLFVDSGQEDASRAVFGDERRDYGAGLRAHYEQGPPEDWPEQYISAYATAHPWEDWAETWAHYLHMFDALETASACGLRIVPPRPDEPALEEAPTPALVGDAFDKMIGDWFSLTYVLNNMNRSLGLADAYPFVLAASVVEKLRFVHETIAAARG